MVRLWTRERAAQADLDHVRGLVAPADADEPEDLERIVALLEKVVEDKAPLPDIEEARAPSRSTA
ncbi:hypothetical protein [Streptomyces sp. NPDC048361]|uniref:hypothetical protein n=1 Tax=Streptomyces sp. NPDC048361 TaxID=3154720 RepID=UPI00342CAF72